MGNNWKHFQKRCDKFWVLTVLNDPFEVQARNIWTAKKPIENHFQEKMWQTLSTTSVFKWSPFKFGWVTIELPKPVENISRKDVTNFEYY
jgi:hypothetical protein